MKRIWFGVGLLILLMILSILVSNLMRNIWQRQAENLNFAAESASDGDWAAADLLLEEATREWKRRQLLIAVLSRHEEIDEIDGLFAQLKVFSNARRTVSFSSTCAALSRLLDSLWQSHHLGLKSLL